MVHHNGTSLNKVHETCGQGHLQVGDGKVRACFPTDWYTQHTGVLQKAIPSKPHLRGLKHSQTVALKLVELGLQTLITLIPCYSLAKAKVRCS